MGLALLSGSAAVRDAPAASAPTTATAPTPRSAQEATGDLHAVPDGSGSAVAIPAVKLDAFLEPIHFEGSVLNPPEDIQRAGLWEDAAALAATDKQPTVIAGHVSDNSDRKGEFSKLWKAKRGDIAVTRDENGKLRYWRAVKIKIYDKAELPRAIFLPGPERTLRLITCAARKVLPGGRFHYEDNLVVDFVPVEAS